MSAKCQTIVRHVLAEKRNLFIPLHEKRKDMKRFLFCLMLAAATTVQAQEVELKEVVVKGARVVQQADRQVIYPTRQQVESSTSGYSLLNKLALPHIRIDEPAHSITALGSQGRVKVRINDVDATTDDLLSMDMKAVEIVEFIDHPGVRYGEDIAYVINIKVRRPVSGYVVGTNLTQSLTNAQGNGSVFGKVNVGKSELGISYRASYANTHGGTTYETATYQLSDGTHHDTERRMTDADYRARNHTLQLTYNLSDTNYVFQAKLSGSQPMGPTRSTSTYEFTENAVTLPYSNHNYGKQKSPSLDLYFHRDFARHQSLTANVVGTYIKSTNHNERNEAETYAYDTEGNTYTLWTEAVYENRLRPFNLSAGLQYMQRYTDNHYSGSTEAHNGMHTSGLYGFAQLSGKLWQRLGYVAGFGMSHRYFRQSQHQHDFLLVRPKLSLSYPLARHLHVKYDFELSQHVSQIALVSDVSIKQNSMETLVGNPDIEPNRVTNHDVRLTYQTPRLTTELQAYYRLNDNCNMTKVIRTSDNHFLNTQTNQKGCDLFFVQPYMQWSIVPEKLDFSIYCGLYRFFNFGDDYTHTYTACNGATWLQAYLGRWTLTAYADNGYNWMEGEGQGHQGALWQLNASYRVNSSLTLALYCQRPFSAHPVTMRSELMNRYLHKNFTQRDSDEGNCLMLNLTWNLSRGRQYRSINRTLNHQDSETGILK